MGVEEIIRRESIERGEKLWEYTYNLCKSRKGSQKIRQSEISPKHKK